MTQHILLPTDGERGVDHAREYAIDLAATLGGTIHGLYVVDESVYGAYPGDEFVQEHEGPQAALEEEGEDALAEIADAAEAAGVTVETSLRYGRPEEEILAEAEDIDADHIVMGSHTRPGAYRQLLGSVSERVLRLTDRPVTVVKTPESAD
jgi:nucleotide-binding universal stress UspA family protein